MNQVKVIILIAPEEKDARKLLADLKGLDRAGWVGVTYYPLSEEAPKDLSNLSSDCLMPGYYDGDLDLSLLERLEKGPDEPTLVN